VTHAWDQAEPAVETAEPETTFADPVASAHAFTSAGPIPPVGRASAEPAPPTASDRAYGAHRTRVADSGERIPRGAKYDPRFVSLAQGSLPEVAAPEDVRLPDKVVAGLDDAWQRSQRAGHRERGGNVVRTYGGDYEYRPGGFEYDDRDTWEPNRKDKGRTQQLVGTYHSHDYTQGNKQGQYPHNEGSFSDSDVANLADLEDHFKLVRSGDTTYMVARTREFDEMVRANEADRSDEAARIKAREAFKQGMRDVFNEPYEAILTADPSKQPEALEAGVKAVARQFHLLYYEGKGGTLHRVSDDKEGK
jgi:hypothetical protein